MPLVARGAGPPGRFSFPVKSPMFVTIVKSEDDILLDGRMPLNMVLQWLR